MRIERSICPLTSWMFATILVRRRLWPFLERLDLSQYWTLRNDFRMISYFRDEAEKVTSAAAACTLYLGSSLHLAQEKQVSARRWVLLSIRRLQARKTSKSKTETGDIIRTCWVQLKDKKDELRRCCHSYSATWPLRLGTDSQPL